MFPRCSTDESRAIAEWPAACDGKLKELAMRKIYWAGFQAVQTLIYFFKPNTKPPGEDISPMDYKCFIMSRNQSLVITGCTSKI